jgi:hypothetical protein
MKTIEDLSKKLAVSDQQFATLWKSFKTIAKLLWTSKDDGRTWVRLHPADSCAPLELYQEWGPDMCQECFSSYPSSCSVGPSRKT